MIALLLALAGAPDPLPTITVTSDNTRIDRSCRVLIPAGAVIEDSDGDGVLHVTADGVTVEFADDATLVAAGFAGRWDALTGVGVRIDGRRNVTLRAPRIRGCRLAVWATHADGLTIENADIADNFRQHLGSRPWAEDSADWLWPHDNDDREWATRYGAAVLVERSSRVTIHGARVRRSQNGIMLDRVNDSRVYDNDCSFLSGWGLAMWRSSRNMVARNALDFCVRGHSEGVYNRGQDSAGLLVFEQCRGNTFAENSATCCGDGFFGFAGKEAIGQKDPVDGPVDYADSGNNDNLILNNDFSFAPAHGLEMTFSARNIIAGNRFVEDAICGVWGGYSRDTLIARNVFARTGGLGYGLERGGVNIEHGSGNRVLENTFDNNRAAFCIWWDQDEPALENLPGVKTPYRGVSDNTFAGNTVRADEKTMRDTFARPAEPPIGFELRDSSGGQKSKFGDNFEGVNTFDFPPAGIPVSSPQGVRPQPVTRVPDFVIPAPGVPGSAHPVGARAGIAGRSHIIMDDWGPWDHESPTVRLGQRSGRGVVYEVRGTSKDLYAENLLTHEKEYWSALPTALQPLKLSIAGAGGYTEYAYRLVDGAWSCEVRGAVVQASWKATFFTNESDPRADESAWRAGSQRENAVTVTLPALDLPFGYNGPARTVRVLDADAGKKLADRAFKANQFGMLATTNISLPRGDWKFIVESDDGVRFKADGKNLIENWSLHGPARDEATLHLPEARSVPLEVEYFQLEGFAVLRLTIERIDGAASPPSP